MQIHKWIQRKYTLPASRVRHRPFWPIPDNILLPPPARVPTSDGIIRRGSLEVTILEVSRLNQALQGDGVYCTVAPGLLSSPSLDRSAYVTEMFLLTTFCRALLSLCLG